MKCAEPRRSKEGKTYQRANPQRTRKKKQQPPPSLYSLLCGFLSSTPPFHYFRTLPPLNVWSTNRKIPAFNEQQVTLLPSPPPPLLPLPVSSGSLRRGKAEVRLAPRFAAGWLRFVRQPERSSGRLEVQESHRLSRRLFSFGLAAPRCHRSSTRPSLARQKTAAQVRVVFLVAFGGRGWVGGEWGVNKILPKHAGIPGHFFKKLDLVSGLFFC